MTATAAAVDCTGMEVAGRQRRRGAGFVRKAP